MSNRKLKEYALYKGDDFIMTSTMSEIAKHLGVEIKTARWYSMPSYYKRFTGKGHIIIRLEDDDRE